MGYPLSTHNRELKQRQLVAILGTLKAMRLLEPHNPALKVMQEDALMEYDKLYQQGVTGF